MLLGHGFLFHDFLISVKHILQCGASLFIHVFGGEGGFGYGGDYAAPFGNLLYFCSKKFQKAETWYMYTYFGYLSIISWSRNIFFLF